MFTSKPIGLSNDDLLGQYQTAVRTRTKLLEGAANGENLLLDLSDAEWLVPTFLTPMSVLYNRLQEEGHSIKIRFPQGHGQQIYLSQIGFPEGAVRPEERYDNSLPLCLLNTDANEDAAEIVGGKIRALLKRHLPDLPPGAITGINYPITEMVDNVDQHSVCGHGALLVQYYPKKECLDICVADDGLSIPGSYDRHGIVFESHEDALRKALAGVSTKEDYGHDRGYGLRTTTKMVCQGLNGQILLSSRDATLLRIQNEEPKLIPDRWHWDGTVFAARLDLPEKEFKWQKYVE